MDVDKLVRMANDIGRFFAADPDPVRARAGVADHLKRFWDPRMRRELLGHFESGGDALSPLVREALAEHRERLRPAG